MKSKLGDPVLAQMEAIRAEGGEDFAVTIDPMYQWYGPAEALHLLKRLEEYPHLKIEDPFPEDMPDMWRRAKETCAVPLAWHARSFASLRRALQERCADAFNVGGMGWEHQLMAYAVEVAGYTCWRGSALELGFSQLTGIHAAAAARATVLPSDFQSGVIREHTLIQWDWPYQDGFLPLPDGPGLGVEVDRDALKHYCQHTATFTAGEKKD